MGYPKRLIADTVRTTAFGGIGGAYTAVGTAIASPARILTLKNLTNQTLAFSDDGVNDKIVLPGNSFDKTDISTNRTTIENFFMAEGTVIYVRHLGVAPTLGAVYVEVIRS